MEVTTNDVFMNDEPENLDNEREDYDEHREDNFRDDVEADQDVLNNAYGYDPEDTPREDDFLESSYEDRFEDWLIALENAQDFLDGKAVE